MEVKSGPFEALSRYQKIVHVVLNRVGIPTEVYWSEMREGEMFVAPQDISGEQELRATFQRPKSQEAETAVECYREQDGTLIPINDLKMNEERDCYSDSGLLDLVAEARNVLRDAKLLAAANPTPENRLAVTRAAAAWMTAKKKEEERKAAL